jgi:CheY-like chemotaxis protein
LRRPARLDVDFRRLLSVLQDGRASPAGRAAAWHSSTSSDFGGIQEKAVSGISAPRNAELTLNGLTEEVSSARFILLAEDNPADVFLLERALNKHLLDFELRVFADGEKAVRFMDAVDADESAALPALILADLNLPKKGGLELLQFVRKSKRSGRVPFLILTSSDSPVDRMETARFGATGYFCKPSSLVEFMEIGRVIKEALAGEPA